MKKDWLTSAMESFCEDELVELARDLIRIPSHPQIEGVEEKVVSYIKAFLDKHKIEAEIRIVEGTRGNILGWYRGKGPAPLLCLNGHTDTVPPYEMDFDPFNEEVKDRIIRGRGAVDMKGPISAMLMALVALQRTQVPLKGSVVFAGVLDEEEGSEGTEALLREGFSADGVIVGEPSNFEYAIGHRGLEWLEIEFIGKAAHGGIPDQGINAIVQAAKFILRVQEKIPPSLKERFHPAMGSSVMNFGKISGGTQPSTVADRCIVQLDRRYLPDETVASVLDEYQKILDELALEDPTFKAELRRMPENLMNHYDHVPLCTDESEKIVISLKDALRKIRKTEPTITTRRGWTDAGLFSTVGKIPTVVFGPGDISFAHSRSEQIRIDDLVQGVEVYLQTIYNFCEIDE